MLKRFSSISFHNHLHLCKLNIHSLKKAHQKAFSKHKIYILSSLGEGISFTLYSSYRSLIEITYTHEFKFVWIDERRLSMVS